jgi:hypothetical protein
MSPLLHILTRPEEAFVRELIRNQQKGGENKVVVIDLTKEGVEHKFLLQSIFAAESVQVW